MNLTFSFIGTTALGLLLGFIPQRAIAAAVDVTSICSAEPSSAIASQLQRPELARAQWSILLQPLDSPYPRYALNENAYFLPASTVKLFTTAAVLQRFGADYRIHTPLYAEASSPVLNRLILAGRGDPSLNGATLQSLARELKARGVREITELIADDRYFTEASRPPSWEFEDLYFAYATAVNPLILAENQFSLTFSPQQAGEPVRLSWEDEIAARQWQIENEATTVTAQPSGIEVRGFFGQPLLQIRGQLAASAQPVTYKLAILNPAQYFLETWRSHLEAEGIRIRQARLAQPGEHWQAPEFSRLESPPIADLIRVVNQSSNNLYAEALLRLLSGNTKGDAREVGLAAIVETLTALGVDPDSYRLADGSGLSRHNLVSGAALVQTLTQMARSQHFDSYRNSLALAGVSGTLANRFNDTPLEGKLWGKTGTLGGVSSLAGYLEDSRQRRYAFSILLNRSTSPASAQRQAIDEILLALAALADCSTNSAMLLSKLPARSP